MTILLDECLPRRLKAHLADHEVQTVPEAGWASISNGRLLALAQDSFDAFITVDRNLSYQQLTQRFAIGIIVLRARSNKLEALAPLMPAALQILQELQHGQVVLIPAAEPQQPPE